MATTTSAPTFIGAVKDEWLMYSDNPEDYTRLSPIGFGASSVVYQAIHHYKDANGKVKDLPCALKVLNLDKLQPSALRLLTRETQLMSLSKVSGKPERVADGLIDRRTNTCRLVASKCATSAW